MAACPEALSGPVTGVRLVGIRTVDLLAVVESVEVSLEQLVACPELRPVIGAKLLGSRSDACC